MLYWILSIWEDESNSEAEDEVSGAFSVLGEAIEAYSESFDHMGVFNPYRKKYLTNLSLIQGKMIARHFIDNSIVVCDNKLNLTAEEVV